MLEEIVCCGDRTKSSPPKIDNPVYCHIAEWLKGSEAPTLSNFLQSVGSGIDDATDYLFNFLAKHPTPKYDTPFPTFDMKPWERVSALLEELFLKAPFNIHRKGLSEETIRLIIMGRLYRMSPNGNPPQSRDWKRNIPEHWYRRYFGDYNSLVQACGLEPYTQESRGIISNSRVYSAISEGKYTYSALCQHLDINPDTIKEILARLMGRGLLFREGNRCSYRYYWDLDTIDSRITEFLSSDEPPLLSSLQTRLPFTYHLLSKILSDFFARKVGSSDDWLESASKSLEVPYSRLELLSHQCRIIKSPLDTKARIVPPAMETFQRVKASSNGKKRFARNKPIEELSGAETGVYSHESESCEPAEKLHPDKIKPRNNNGLNPFDAKAVLSSLLTYLRNSRYPKIDEITSQFHISPKWAADALRAYAQEKISHQLATNGGLTESHNALSEDGIPESKVKYFERQLIRSGYCSVGFSMIELLKPQRIFGLVTFNSNGNGEMVCTLNRDAVDKLMLDWILNSGTDVGFDYYRRKLPFSTATLAKLFSDMVTRQAKAMAEGNGNLLHLLERMQVPYSGFERVAGYLKPTTHINVPQL